MSRKDQRRSIVITHGATPSGTQTVPDESIWKTTGPFFGVPSVEPDEISANQEIDTPASSGITTGTEWFFPFSSLERRVRLLETTGCKSIPINALPSDDFELIRPVVVAVEPSGEEYLATFIDANIGASGDTEIAAIDNLKDMILLTYETLLEFDVERLGPGPLVQRQILDKFVRRK